MSRRRFFLKKNLNLFLLFLFFGAVFKGSVREEGGINQKDDSEWRGSKGLELRRREREGEREEREGVTISRPVLIYSKRAHMGTGDAISFEYAKAFVR